MRFDPYLAAIRFGTGLGPDLVPPADPAALLADLTGPDDTGRAIPIASFAALTPSIAAIKDAARARRDAVGTDGQDAANEAHKAITRQALDERAAQLRATLARMSANRIGFRERMVRFWADHFTMQAKTNQLRHAISPAVEEAIRPRIAGRFADLLRAAVLHPVMLLSLDQHLSHGPNSLLGQRRGRGLNENLARELLELHTLGVGAGYRQSDVRELAELLTGLTYQPRRGFIYDDRLAEPGAETVLGVTYDSAASLDTVLAALDDLAAHPETAAHLCEKLAVHFIGPAPEPGVLTDMIATYLATDGDLAQVTAAMIEHPAAHSPLKRKVRRPLEYMAAAIKALGVPEAELLRLDETETRRGFAIPLQIMGQPWEGPQGPDGWPEADEAWITPQGMAGRISWAMEMPAKLRRDLPDPRDFVHHALGPDADADVTFAARAAEARIDGVGVVLASAAFQRR